MTHGNDSPKRPHLDYPFAPLPKAVVGRIPEIGASAFVTYCLLLDHANGKGECYPHIATLAAEAGVNKKTIERSLKTLKVAGLITMKRGQYGNRYTVVVPCPNGSEATKTDYLEPMLDSPE